MTSCVGVTCVDSVCDTIVILLMLLFDVSVGMFVVFVLVLIYDAVVIGIAVDFGFC